MGLASLAVYGPFVLMAAYTLAAVPCGHCKKAAWMVLPCAPALIPMDAAVRWLHPRGFTNPFVPLSLGLGISVSAVFLLAYVARLGRMARIAALGISFVVLSGAAILLLARIRG